MDHFAGLDVSVKATSVCIVDDAGKVVREVKVTSEPETLLALEAATAAGPAAVESVGATMHRQPTPRSIAAAEVQLGNVSKEQTEAVGAAMVRAGEADRVGDQSACEQALSDAERALSQR
jgi:hypothetical protein